MICGAFTHLLKLHDKWFLLVSPSARVFSTLIAMCPFYGFLFLTCVPLSTLHSFSPSNGDIFWFWSLFYIFQLLHTLMHIYICTGTQCRL